MRAGCYIDANAIDAMTLDQLALYFPDDEWTETNEASLADAFRRAQEIAAELPLEVREARIRAAKAEGIL